MQQSKKRTTLLTLGILGITGALVTGAVLISKNNETSTVTKNDTTSDVADTTEDTTSNPSATTETESSTTSAYKDGTYTATGSYNSPGGNESIGVSLTLKDGVITATSATEEATSRDGEEYQELFIAAYKSLVIGKSIDNVSLDRVSGSSLTSNGFKDAVDEIKQQAKA